MTGRPARRVPRRLRLLALAAACVPDGPPRCLARRDRGSRDRWGLVALVVVSSCVEWPDRHDAAAQTTADARKITATLYFVSEDGMSLVGVQREVAFGETVLEQAKQIVTAQLAAGPAPLVSAIPPSTTLRAIYLTERGDAFVDLSATARTAHTGGALDELFTVYRSSTRSRPTCRRSSACRSSSRARRSTRWPDTSTSGIPCRKTSKWVRTEKGDT